MSEPLSSDPRDPASPSCRSERRIRVTADGASVGTEFQSRVADGKYECRYTCQFWSGRLGVGGRALRSYGFWTQVDLQRGLLRQVRS